MSENNSILATEDEIVEEFDLFDSWDDKYEYIIDLGKKLPPLEEQHKKDENRVRGCQSTVWLVSDYRDGKIFFKADSDSVIVKGLISTPKLNIRLQCNRIIALQQWIQKFMDSDRLLRCKAFMKIIPLQPRG